MRKLEDWDIWNFLPQIRHLLAKLKIQKNVQTCEMKLMLKIQTQKIF